MVQFGTSVVHCMTVLGVWLAWAWKRPTLVLWSLAWDLVGVMVCNWLDTARTDESGLGPSAYVTLCMAIFFLAVGAALCPVKWYWKPAVFVGGTLLLALEVVVIGLWLFATNPLPVL